MNQSKIYDNFWKALDIIEKPESWSTWEIIKDFQGKKILELGPGNFPKTPIKGGFFIEVSEQAVQSLKKIGANAVLTNGVDILFENDFFDLIVAIEVLEHIKDDEKALAEISRTLKPSGSFLFSVPMKMDLYSEFDKAVGHERRYEIDNLISLLSNSGLEILKYRGPSFYSRILNDFFITRSLKRVFFKTGVYKKAFNSSRKANNFYSRAMAFFDKKGAPPWQKDIENLSKYNQGSIVILCQKK